MRKKEYIIKEELKSKSIEGGVLPKAEQVRYGAGKTIRHSAELSRSPKSKI